VHVGVVLKHGDQRHRVEADAELLHDLDLGAQLEQVARRRRAALGDLADRLDGHARAGARVDGLAHGAKAAGADDLAELVALR
jgi:hypothetical protein